LEKLELLFLGHDNLATNMEIAPIRQWQFSLAIFHLGIFQWIKSTMHTLAIRCPPSSQTFFTHQFFAPSTSAGFSRLE